MIFGYIILFTFLGFGLLNLILFFEGVGVLIAGLTAFGCLCTGAMMLWNKLKSIEDKLDQVLKSSEDRT